jgi:hypothetical protein
VAGFDFAGPLRVELREAAVALVRKEMEALA